MENIHDSWKELFNRHKFDLDTLYNSYDIIYPSRENIFRVFR